MMPRWLLYALIAVLFWGLWALLSKVVGASMSAAQSQAISTLGIIPVVSLLAFSRRLGASSRDNRRRGICFAFTAGLLTCGGNLAYYHALALGGKASTVTPLTAMYPVVTILLALTFLGERLNWIQLFGLALSLTAIALFNVSGLDGWLTGWLAYALVPVGLWGLAGLLQKISTNHISGELSTLWFLLAFLPVALALWFWDPLRASLPTTTWIYAIGLGLLFGLGNYGLLLAFANDGKASVITPLGGLYPLVSVPLALAFLGEKISIREGAGIALAVIAVIALAQETKPNPAAADSH